MTGPAEDHTGPILPTPGDEEAAQRAAAAAARFAATAEPDIAYAVIDTPVGRLVAATSGAGLVRLAYEDFNGGVDAILGKIAERVSPRILEAPPRLDEVRRELEEYFSGQRRAFGVPIDWSVYSTFGRAVLQATAAIPFGRTATYGEVAERAGNVKASRAAGRALGANPVPIIVPCHRVVGTSGRLTGSTGGLHRNAARLRLAGVRACARRSGRRGRGARPRGGLSCSCPSPAPTGPWAARGAAWASAAG